MSGKYHGFDTAEPKKRTVPANKQEGTVQCGRHSLFTWKRAYQFLRHRTQRKAPSKESQGAIQERQVLMPMSVSGCNSAVTRIVCWKRAFPLRNRCRWYQSNTVWYSAGFARIRAEV